MMLVENGENISGGQKTRVNLARTLYRKKKIHIFDEPLTSVGQAVSDAIFQDAILTYLEG